MAGTIQAIHFVDEQPSATQTVVQVYADNLPEGGGTYTLPAATASALGGVKMAATTPDVNASAAATAAGDAPTKAEFNAVVALANATRATLNALLGRLEAAGIVASK